MGQNSNATKSGTRSVVEAATRVHIVGGEVEKVTMPIVASVFGEIARVPIDVLEWKSDP